MQNCYFRAKLIIFGKTVCIFRQMWLCFTKWLHSGKSVFIRANWLYSGKSGCIRAKVVVFGQSGCIQAKVVLFGQSGCIKARWLNSCKIVVFGQKWLYS